jgi:DNA-directed RNA polymerase sigma subunit (sigma70/sigma32)
MRIAEDREVSLMAIDQYLRQVRWIPPLTDEEEERLMACVERGKAERGKSCPDEQVLADTKRARDRLVEGYQRLVMYLARRYLYYTRRLEWSDLIQEGNLGLMEAIERHDVRTGYRLSALAGRCISTRLFAAIWERDGLVPLPGGVSRALARVAKAERHLVLVLGREPSSAELAREVGVSEDRLCQLLAWRRVSQVESLEGLLVEEDTEEHWGCVGLAGERSSDDGGSGADLEEVVQQACEGLLSPGQWAVIRLRYGLDDGGEQHQPREVAQLLGKPSYSVYTLESQAKNRLRPVLAPFVPAVLLGVRRWPRVVVHGKPRASGVVTIGVAPGLPYG